MGSRSKWSNWSVSRPGLLPGGPASSLVSAPDRSGGPPPRQGAAAFCPVAASGHVIVSRVLTPRLRKPPRPLPPSPVRDHAHPSTRPRPRPPPRSLRLPRGAARGPTASGPGAGGGGGCPDRPTGPRSRPGASASARRALRFPGNIRSGADPLDSICSIVFVSFARGSAHGGRGSPPRGARLPRGGAPPRARAQSGARRPTTVRGGQRGGPPGGDRKSVV